MTKTLFFGTPHIAVPALKAIAALANYEIVGVGVFPDKAVGRKQILTPCPVKQAAQELCLPIHEISNKTELVEMFKTVEHDLSIVIAFGMIFPAEVLELTTLGVVNVHFSLLPEYRGASPVQQAILDGQLESGITWQRMVSALDAGDILWQRLYDIRDKTTAQIWEEFADLTAQEMPSFLDAYTKNQVSAITQKESEATFCGKFKKTDGQMDLNTHSATQIYNAWRAFQPWPGVSVNTAKGLLKLHDASLEPSENRVEITAAGGSKLWVKTAQLSGKPKALLSDILHGNPDLLNTNN